MKRVKPATEPATFDDRCRKRGQNWLKSHPNYRRPQDHWSEFEPDPRLAFNEPCGYCATATMKSQVDHFISVAVLKATNQDALAYEWKNFRYGEGVINQRKSKHRVLDPFKSRMTGLKFFCLPCNWPQRPQSGQVSESLWISDLSGLGCGIARSSFVTVGSGSRCIVIRN
jgi:hypothetical protein